MKQKTNTEKLVDDFAKQKYIKLGDERGFRICVYGSPPRKPETQGTVGVNLDCTYENLKDMKRLLCFLETNGFGLEKFRAQENLTLNFRAEKLGWYDIAIDVIKVIGELTEGHTILKNDASNFHVSMDGLTTGMMNELYKNKEESA